MAEVMATNCYCSQRLSCVRGLWYDAETGSVMDRCVWQEDILLYQLPDGRKAVNNFIHIRPKHK